LNHVGGLRFEDCTPCLRHKCIKVTLFVCLAPLATSFGQTLNEGAINTSQLTKHATDVGGVMTSSQLAALNSSLQN
jgi:hypothetical protein